LPLLEARPPASPNSSSSLLLPLLPRNELPYEKGVAAAESTDEGRAAAAASKSPLAEAAGAAEDEYAAAAAVEEGEKEGETKAQTAQTLDPVEF
jgi:hypothetical protein